MLNVICKKPTFGLKFLWKEQAQQAVGNNGAMGEAHRVEGTTSGRGLRKHGVEAGKSPVV